MFDLSYLHLLQLSAQDPHLLTQRLNLLTDQLTARIFTPPPSDDGGGPFKEHTAVLFHPASGSRRRQGWEKPGFFLKKPGQWGFLGFFVFLVFLYNCPEEKVFRVFSVLRIL
jgi:hypothetical protein